MQEKIIKTALLVEDSEIIQRVLSMQLANLGYQVTAVSDATSGIEALNNHHYSLIVTDLRLPDKSGEEVIKAARQSDINQGTPLIVCSAQLSKSDFKTYLDLGADKVLIKPISSQNLEDTIKSCQLNPYYKRRFFYQMKLCIKSFEENIQQPKTEEEFELWFDHFLNLLTQTIRVLQEYRQWYEFEKLKFKGKA
jgi:CheY-like chemotaxis protein